MATGCVKSASMLLTSPFGTRLLRGSAAPGTSFRLALVGLVACLLSACAHGDLRNHPGVWQERQGAFRALLVLTEKHEALLDAWRHAPDARVPPDSFATSTIHKGKKLDAVVFFANCLGAGPEPCDLTADFALRNPDGSLYFEYRNLPLQIDPPGAPDEVMLGNPYVGFIAEPSDPVGRYVFEVMIRSPGGAAVLLRRSLDVVEGSAE